MCCAASGLLAYALTRRRPRLATWLVPALLVLLFARVALDARPDWEWTLLPWPGYALVQGFVLYALATVFFGVAASRLPVPWNRAAVGVLAALVLGHGMVRHSYLAWPERHGEERVAGPDHHLRQSTMHTCGPAACVSALSYFGEVRTERQMAELCLCRKGGSRLFELYRGLVLALDEERYSVGIEALDAAALLAEDRVVVASNGSGAHAIAIRTSGGEATVHDPLTDAPQRWTRSQLERDYRSPAIVIRSRQALATPR